MTCSTPGTCQRDGAAAEAAAKKSDDEKDRCSAVRSFERACELGARPACARAAKLLLFPSELVCSQRQVCFLVGASCCTPPCEGTEVNFGCALEAYGRACELGDGRACVRALKIAASMEPMTRVKATSPGMPVIRGHSGCSVLTGQNGWSAWTDKLGAELARLPDSTPRETLCRDSAKYCDGFRQPCATH